MSNRRPYNARTKRLGNSRNTKSSNSLPDIEVEIEKWTPGGDCLARHEGKVVFVKGAIPGEVVKVKLSEQKKDFSKGKVIEVIQSSKNRVKPFCPVYDECGGCTMQHLNSESQLNARKDMVEDSFRRIGGIDLVEQFGSEWPVVVGQDKHYRSRARFHKAIINKSAGSDKEKVIWGFRKEKSHHVCDATQCQILSPAISKTLEDFSTSRKLTSFISNSRINSVNIITNNYKSDFLNLNANCAHDIKHFENGMSPLDIDVCGKKIKADAKVFFQSNLELLPELVKFVQKNIETIDDSKREAAIDLFSGVGFFSVFLQDVFEVVYAVERDKYCLKYSEENTKDNVISITASAEDWMKSKDAKKSNLLLVDPPRTGLAKEVTEAVLSLKPEYLMYVSCNPVTLARDLKTLKTDYEIKDISGFDFYPQTPHLEMAVFLKHY